MSIVSGDPDGIARGMLINPFARGELPAPGLVIPVAAKYPFPWFELGGKAGNEIGEIAAASRLPEFHPGESEPSLEKMNM